MDRLKQRGADLVYRCGKGHAEPLQSDKYASELVLTPLELLHLAHLAPPPPSEPPAKPKPRPSATYPWAAPR